MHYLVALGNPGEKYSRTRHNVGFMVVDNFIATHNLPQPINSSSCAGRLSEAFLAGQELKVLYPDTFMNKSGSAVAKLVPRSESPCLIVVHDDIDLPFGEIKVAVGRGAGGNNGVKSIIDKLGTKDFIRIRIGIAPKSFWTGTVKRPAGGGPLEKFVLRPFSITEKSGLPQLFEKTNSAIQTIIEKGVEEAMNVHN